MVLYETKKVVSISLHTVSAKDLAQTLVEGYYAVMGSSTNITSIVVALTSIEVTHYFKLQLPNT